jgi:hypothetical protein
MGVFMVERKGIALLAKEARLFLGRIERRLGVGSIFLIDHFKQ